MKYEMSDKQYVGQLCWPLQYTKTKHSVAMSISKQNTYTVNEKETKISKTEEMPANNFTYKISWIKVIQGIQNKWTMSK